MDCICLYTFIWWFIVGLYVLLVLRCRYLFISDFLVLKEHLATLNFILALWQSMPNHSLSVDLDVSIDVSVELCTCFVHCVTEQTVMKVLINIYLNRLFACCPPRLSAQDKICRKTIRLCWLYQCREIVYSTRVACPKKD